MASGAVVGHIFAAGPNDGCWFSGVLASRCSGIFLARAHPRTRLGLPLIPSDLSRADAPTRLTSQPTRRRCCRGDFLKALVSPLSCLLPVREISVSEIAADAEPTLRRSGQIRARGAREIPFGRRNLRIGHGQSHPPGQMVVRARVFLPNIDGRVHPRTGLRLRGKSNEPEGTL